MSGVPKVIPPNAKYQPQDPQYVSNDTFSKDPNVMKARVFAGCFHPDLVKREDIIELFSMYGPLHGVTHFERQGYGFIQFEQEEDAIDAVANLNNFYLHEMNLDVKIATPKETFMKSIPKPIPLGQPIPNRKRGGRKERERRLRKQLMDDGYPFEEIEKIVAERRIEDEKEKMERERLLKLENERVRKEREGQHQQFHNDFKNQRPPPNRGFSQEPKSSAQRIETIRAQKEKKEKMLAEELQLEEGETTSNHPDEGIQTHSKHLEPDAKKVKEVKEEPLPPKLNQNEIPDIFICGGCHLITANAQFFFEHRLVPCDRKVVKKGEDEPETLKCYQCKLNCKNSWDLINHMAQSHKLNLFNKNAAKTLEVAEDS